MRLDARQCQLSDVFEGLIKFILNLLNKLNYFLQDLVNDGFIDRSFIVHHSRRNFHERIPAILLAYQILTNLFNLLQECQRQ